MITQKGLEGLIERIEKGGSKNAQLISGKNLAALLKCNMPKLEENEKGEKDLSEEDREKLKPHQRLPYALRSVAELAERNSEGRFFLSPAYLTLLKDAKVENGKFVPDPQEREEEEIEEEVEESTDDDDVTEATDNKGLNRFNN